MTSLLLLRTPHFEKHVDLVEIVLDILIDAKLKCKASKISFAGIFTQFLGVIYHNGKYGIPELRLAAYMDQLLPGTTRQLHAFLASLSYYRRFIPNYAALTYAMHLLVVQFKGKRLVWNDEAKESFEAVKEALRNAVMLYVPVKDREWLTFSDASQVGAGFILEQMDPKTGDRFPVAYSSKLFSKSERNYSTYRKEILSLIYGLESNCHFLQYAPVIHSYVDSKSICYLKLAKHSNNFLMRMAIALSCFNIRIYHLSGSCNSSSDFLSRYNPRLQADKEVLYMSEKQAEKLLNYMKLKEGTELSVEEVENMLCGGSFAAPPNKPIKYIESLPKHPIMTNNSIPNKKLHNKATLPPTVDPHPLYKNQRKELGLPNKQGRFKDKLKLQVITVWNNLTSSLERVIDMSDINDNFVPYLTDKDDCLTLIDEDEQPSLTEAKCQSMLNGPNDTILHHELSLDHIVVHNQADRSPDKRHPPALYNQADRSPRLQALHERNVINADEEVEQQENRFDSLQDSISMNEDLEIDSNPTDGQTVLEKPNRQAEKPYQAEKPNQAEENFLNPNPVDCFLPETNLTTNSINSSIENNFDISSQNDNSEQSETTTQHDATAEQLQLDHPLPVFGPNLNTIKIHGKVISNGFLTIQDFIEQQERDPYFMQVFDKLSQKIPISLQDN